jgi:hypothetical protein
MLAQLKIVSAFIAALHLDGVKIRMDLYLDDVKIGFVSPGCADRDTADERDG